MVQILVELVFAMGIVKVMMVLIIVLSFYYVLLDD